MYKDGFGEKLKKAREKAGYTQQQVEDETGIRRANLSRYENGKLEPDIETIGTLANFYEITTDWLYGLGKQKKD